MEVNYCHKSHVGLTVCMISDVFPFNIADIVDFKSSKGPR